MKAPQRLIDDNALFSKLVDADNRQEPRADVLEDLLRKLPPPKTVTAVPARPTSRLRNWMPLAILGACALTSAAVFELSRASRPTIDSAPPVSAPAPSAPPAHEAPTQAPASGPAIPTVSIDDLPTSKPKAESAPSAPSGRREIELIIAAREALTRQEADRCLAAVRAYEAEYPAGQYTLEAKVMRIEATAARGDVSRARVLAGDFLQKNPSSFYDERVRSLLASLEAR